MRSQKPWKLISRALLGVLIIAVLLLQVVGMRRGRSKFAFPKRPVSQELKSPLEADLSDISKWRDDSDVVISRSPLCRPDREVAKLIYDVQTELINGYETTGGDDAGVTTRLPGIYPSQKNFSVKEIAFQDTHIPDAVRFSERKKFKAPTASIIEKIVSAFVNRPGIMYADGRIELEGDGQNLSSYREVEPMFVQQAVRSGDSWSQELSCDPQLNPDGKVKAEIKLLATYTQNSRRFVRLSRYFAVKARQPIISIPGLVPADRNGNSAKEPPGTIYQRVREVFDLDLNNGVVVEKISVVQTHLDRANVHFANGRGIITMAKESHYLREIIKK